MFVKLLLVIIIEFIFGQFSNNKFKLLSITLSIVIFVNVLFFKYLIFLPSRIENIFILERLFIILKNNSFIFKGRYLDNITLISSNCWFCLIKFK